MKSMTGYAFKELITEDYSTSVEIKSYNARFLDLSINVPPFLSRLEHIFRERASKYVQRGKIEIHIKFREKNLPLQIETDLVAAKKYADVFRTVAKEIKLEKDIPLNLVVAQEGVVNVQRTQDIDLYLSYIMPVFDEAFKIHTKEREREGQQLCADITAMTDKIEEATDFFATMMPQMEKVFVDNLKKRFAEIAATIDENRIAQETATLLVKHTINEEVVRLQNHLQSLRIELGQVAPGRKIDFICQEINREINTIGSKNQLVDVAARVITAKDALENIREQARNIE